MFCVHAYVTFLALQFMNSASREPLRVNSFLTKWDCRCSISPVGMILGKPSLEKRRFILRLAITFKVQFLPAIDLFVIIWSCFDFNAGFKIKYIMDSATLFGVIGFTRDYLKQYWKINSLGVHLFPLFCKRLTSYINFIVDTRCDTLW